MKTLAQLFAVFFGINLILWLGTQLIDTFQWIAEALILTGITGLLAVWLRIAFGRNK